MVTIDRNGGIDDMTEASQPPDTVRSGLIAALMSQVIREGYKTVDLQTVSAEAGFGLAATQEHFPALSDLVEATLLGIHERNRVALAALAIKHDPIGKFAIWLTDGFRADRARCLAELELFVCAARVPALRPAARRWITNRSALVAGWTDSRRTVRTVCACVDGLLLQALVTDETPEADAVASAIREVCR